MWFIIRCLWQVTGDLNERLVKRDEGGVSYLLLTSLLCKSVDGSLIASLGCIKGWYCIKRREKEEIWHVKM